MLDKLVLFLLLTRMRGESLECRVGSNYRVPAASIDSGTLSSRNCSNEKQHCVRLEGTATVTLFDFQPNTASKTENNNIV